MNDFFDKQKFLAANQRNKENNPFGDIDDGFYLAELTKAEFGQSKAGNNQAIFHWKIDHNSPTNPDKIITEYPQLAGPNADIGYSILEQRARKLGCPMEVFIENTENIMQSFIGTKARLQLYTNDKGYQNLKILNVSEYGFKKEQVASAPPNQPPVNTQIAPSDDEPLYKQGDRITVTTSDGQRSAIVQAYHKASNKLMIKYESDGAVDLIEPNQVAGNGVSESLEQVEQIEEIEELKEEIQLAIGMSVKGLFNSTQVINGTIHDFNADGTKVKILVIKDGKKQVYPCPLETIEVFGV